MSKAQFYDPKQLRAPGEIHFQDIDVCKYQKTVADELKGDSFTKEDMLRIYRDMEYIREFESMLKSVRLTKAYNGVEYTYTCLLYTSLFAYSDGRRAQGSIKPRRYSRKEA